MLIVPYGAAAARALRRSALMRLLLRLELARTALPRHHGQRRGLSVRHLASNFPEQREHPSVPVRAGTGGPFL